MAPGTQRPKTSAAWASASGFTLAWWRSPSGWALLCDKLHSINPAGDPEGDYDYAPGGEEEPEKQIINEVLHNMISKAEQAPDVRLVGPDASDEEVGGEEDKEESE